MTYYEVMIADSKYHSAAPLTYSSESIIQNFTLVTVPLRNRLVSGFVVSEVAKPPFKVKDIKASLSDHPLPYHCFRLAEWISEYYCCTLAEVMRQFAPAAKVVRRNISADETSPTDKLSLNLDSPLTAEQKNAIAAIENHASTTVLLHGATGSGKTRVYLELAEKVLAAGRSVIILTPEIALTAQLAYVAKLKLKSDVVLLHSELTPAERKKIWFKVLESSQPLVIVGARSALFAPLGNLGLIVVDESHEPAYKQDQAPRYHAVRVASQLGLLTGAKVVLGSATPSVSDYYIASQHKSIVSMKHQAKTGRAYSVNSTVIDARDRGLFRKNPHLSDELIADIALALDAKKQILIYYNRRGSARLMLCNSCGWQMLCPNCDIPLTYHADEHLARCHICGFKEPPPAQCPVCQNPDIIFKSIGSKTLEQILQKLFPFAKVRRFDSDNRPGQRLNESYNDILHGDVDILVGTQLLAKGLDLPRLGLVGIVAAEASLGLPDFSSEERTFQLLYQVIGRVGRGSSQDKVVIQTYEPDSPVIKAALGRDWTSFYKETIKERQAFRFPPFSYLLKMVCKRATLAGAAKAAESLRDEFLDQRLPVEVTGPTPSFYGRRGKNYYYQLVVKSKQRPHLVALAKQAPVNWQCDLDPVDLL